MDTLLSHQARAKQIGDFVYTVAPIGALDGKKAFVRLGNVIGPALNALKLDPNGSPEDAIGAFASSIGNLLTSLKFEDLEYFERLFAPQTRVRLSPDREPKLSDIPEHFAPAGGHFDHYIPWLVHALDVNFGEVFRGAWRANVAKFSAAKEKQSP